MDIAPSIHWCTWSNYLGGVQGKTEKAEQKQLKHSVNVEIPYILRRVFPAVLFSETGRQVSWAWEQTQHKDSWRCQGKVLDKLLISCLQSSADRMYT